MVATLVVLGAACGSSSPSASSQPQALLAQAKAALDGTQAFHFTLTTAGLPRDAGTTVVGGQGDLMRPDKLVGSFAVSAGGLPVTVRVAAGGGRFFAQLPFASGFTATDPESFGVANPAQLISPNGGLSSILRATQQATSAGQARVQGEVLDVVSGSVPGTAITVVPDKDPSRPVAIKAFISPSSHQLRQLVLIGPIESTASTTFTVTLTGYGQHVNLALPSP